jgi:uncharacterized protein (DUF2235 family)
MKRIVFCFDGTWNRIDAKTPTNVLLTAESILPLGSADGNIAQLIYYHEGVGTGKWDRISGGAFGAGLLRNIVDAYRFLIFNYTAGDELYVFGFSRGAYTARSFVGLVATCGILSRRNVGKVTDAVKLYHTRNASSEFLNQMMNFRSSCCDTGVCVSDSEISWRSESISGFDPDKATRLRVRYLGVWDTVGALGIPASFSLLTFLNRHKYEFHDVSLSPFVESARHAVAIDERRKDFLPALWDNLDELNSSAHVAVDADDAPYLQRWFPGTHSSVGGGGERRGLSDQCLDWILDGARRQGLVLDVGPSSRIYEMKPDYTEFLENAQSPGFLYRAMKAVAPKDRLPGPTRVSDVGTSAKRRWASPAEALADKQLYRPKSLDHVADALSKIDPASLRVNVVDVPALVVRNFAIYIVQPGDTLTAIAYRFYGDAQKYKLIYDLNGKLESPDKIYAGQSLRIPQLPDYMVST